MKSLGIRVAAVLSLGLLSVLGLTQPASATEWTEWHANSPNCRWVYVQSTASNYVVAAELGGGDRRLRARTSPANADTWELFRLRGVGYDYTLMSANELSYVSADIGGDGTLYARAAVADTWEKFHIFTYDHDGAGVDLVNIMSAANSRWVSADIGGDGTLRARATVNDRWEGFRVFLLGDTWAC
ncbi:hypothetical protein PV458_36530 [Streptomyces sp. MN03-5084-2B]|nr:hypothetical protein [Streptomyces sp. MN03-5084-2B]